MSLESGGRADKYGNTYENNVLAKAILRLIREDIQSVTVEPLGPDGKGVEFFEEEKNGAKTYYQCKASNAMKDKWSLSDLNRYNIFQFSKELIQRGKANKYKFISPLPYNHLDELCNRARTNGSSDDFIKYQLNNDKMRNLFHHCAQYYKLSTSKKGELDTLVEILARSYFKIIPRNSETEKNLDMFIGYELTGNPSEIRVLLGQYANTHSRYGVAITAREVINYLESCNIKRRSEYKNERVLSKIDTLNDTYWGVYKPINNKLIPRVQSSEAIKKLSEVKSLIIHGKAGSGKSGCVQEIITHLKSTNTLYLAIKLDKKIPKGSADQFGKDLGLSQSPVYCLNSLSASTHCVLILDQLDSLRWTSMHSADALDVCKELINQAETINKSEKGSISIVFVSRTFDFENDKGIKSLFETTGDFGWEQINVDLLSEKEVSTIVGESYPQLSPRLKTILRTPSSLFIWAQLDAQKKTNTIKSVYGLMSIWWEQIQEECERLELSHEKTYNCVERIIKIMDRKAQTFLPKNAVKDQTNVIQRLISLDLLIEIQNAIAFSHQSFFDYFIATNIIKGIYEEEKNIPEYFGEPDTQTPNLRYKILFVLQSLIDDDFNVFLIQAKLILESNNIRYYYKCAVFDVIGQYETPNIELFELVKNYYDTPEWRDYILQTVFYGHPQFIYFFKDNNTINWITDENISLLRSIVEISPDFVEKIITPYMFKSEDTDFKLYYVLAFSAKNDSDSLFKLRMKFYEYYPDLLYRNHLIFHQLIPNHPARAIQILKFVLLHHADNTFKNLYMEKDINLEIFLYKNYKEIIENLFPLICSLAFESSNFSNSDIVYEGIWPKPIEPQSFERNLTELIKHAMTEYVKQEPLAMQHYINCIEYPMPTVGYEILMHGIQNLSIEHSTWVINWLLQHFNNTFIYTCNASDYLFYTKEIIRKFSPSCGSVEFQLLENRILLWKEDKEEMLRIYQNRIQMNKCKDFSPTYIPFWGKLQKELLSVMDDSRLSTESKQLIKVLNRNPWIRIPAYHSNCIIKPEPILSPLDKNIDRINDNTWLKIISQTIENNRIDSCSLQVKIELFSRSLYRQTQKQPNRFVSLLLKFPETTPHKYITSIIDALSSVEIKEHIEPNLIIQVVNKYSSIENDNVILSILRLISTNRDISYPLNILDQLEYYASEYQNSSKQQHFISLNKKNISTSQIQTQTLNEVRSLALKTIAHLIWAHTDLVNRFKPLVKEACNDSDVTILFSVLSCIYAFYNIDSQFAVPLLKQLLINNLCILESEESWSLIVEDYQNSPDFYRDCLLSGCKTEIKHLCIRSAELLCATAIYFNDDAAYSYLIENSFTSEQEDKICNRAIYYFEKEEYHGKSKLILTHFIGASTNSINSLFLLFSRKKIIFPRDMEFIQKLINSSQVNNIASDVIEYILQLEDTTGCAELLRNICELMAKDKQNRQLHIVPKDLIKCVLHIFDRSKADIKAKRICLDIWDYSFKNNLLNIKQFTNMIDEIL